ncbi:MAG TPA: DUF1549 domain-containing protein [Thermoanaerobaculia bacterium]|nr:DUF1549 domain-containing protein [Thermoanaerobaculia bacterium]
MRRLLLLVAPLLLLNAGSSSFVCRLPLNFPTSKEITHSVSVTAEAVAPSGRRRSTTPPANGTPGQQIPLVNFIDVDVFGKMATDGIAPTTLSTDEEFLRRVSLDLTGQIPDSAAVTAFVADTTPDKRAKKIDELLASDAFADRWTMWFGDLVQNVQVASNSREFYEGRNVYYNWMKTAFKNGEPYDQMAREAMAGKGDSFAVGTPNYYVRQLQPNGPIQDTFDNLATHSGERFLGMPLLCLSCHNGFAHLEQVNSYLAAKKRADLWSMSAFFAHTRATPQPGDPNNPNVRKYMVDDTAPNGTYLLNTVSGNKTPRCTVDATTGKCTGTITSASPAFILTGETPRQGEPLRDAYGRMVTAHEQFGRAAVNYIWKEMFGLAIIEPTNNIDPAKLDTQATNPKLLEDLRTSFVASGYNFKALLRSIAISSTYQLSTKYTPGGWNEAWTADYPRHYPHRLSSEMLLDAIAKSTNVFPSFNVQGIGTVTKAMQLPDTTEQARNAYGRLLDEFGRGNRDEVMRTNDSSIAQALSLMNDTIVTTRVKRTTNGSTVNKIMASTTDPGSIADQLYLATLSRKPTSSERSTAISYLQSGNLQQKTEDLQFALLNSLEFLFN